VEALYLFANVLLPMELFMEPSSFSAAVPLWFALLFSAHGEGGGWWLGGCLFFLLVLELMS